MTYCYLGTNRTADKMSLASQILVVSELLAICCCFALLFINKRRKSRLTTASLTEKYQVDENIRAIQLLIPTALTHAIIFIPPLCFYSVHRLITNTDKLDYPLIFESTLSAPVYGVVLPVVLFWRNRSLRNALRRKLNLNSVHESQVSEHSRIEQDAHFATLNILWAQALQRNQIVQQKERV